MPSIVAQLHHLAKLVCFFRRWSDSMEQYVHHPNPYTGFGFPPTTSKVDPIVRSNRLSLPFPCEAATLLGSKRSAHFEIDESEVAAAQQRLYLMASMMGIWDWHDEPPTAA
jgi:hypothetical protein